MKKKVISALLCVAMVSSMLIGCGGSDDTTTPAPADDAATETEAEAPADDAAADAEAEAPADDAAASAEGGSVYYMNFKPEQADDWVALAAKYTEQTGVQVDVVTAASGTYESTLK